MGQVDVEGVGGRWLFLVVAVVVMMVISIYQYSWSLYGYAIRSELGWSDTAISLAFTLFVYASTFVQPASGFLADTYGPRKVALTSAVLTGLGFILSSLMHSPPSLYLAYSIGALGVGTLYGVSTATAVKWFPERRGLATGIVTFGFGAGTSLFNPVIQQLISSYGFRAAFLYVGVFMLVTLIPTSLLLKYPKHYLRQQLSNTKGRVYVSPVNFRPTEMLRTRQWYLIYFSFIITPAIVLMFGAQLKMISNELQIPPEYLNAALITFPLASGLSRIIAGAVSDRIGRERAMVIFYTLLGLSTLGLVYLGNSPPLFVAFVTAASLLGGSPYTFYPSIISDYYGPKYATANYGLTYTAKAWAGLISGWLTAYLVELYGTYKLPLLAIAIACFVAAFTVSPIVLRPPKPITRWEDTKTQH